VRGGGEREGVGELGWAKYRRGSRGSNTGVGQTVCYCFEEGKRKQIEGGPDFVGEGMVGEGVCERDGQRGEERRAPRRGWPRHERRGNVREWPGDGGTVTRRESHIPRELTWRAESTMWREKGR
jgi:hypothetical protein